MGTFQTSQFQIIRGFFDQPNAGPEPSEAWAERRRSRLDPARAAGLTDLRTAGVRAI